MVALEGNVKSIRDLFNDFKIASKELIEAIFGENSDIEEYDNIDAAIKATKSEDVPDLDKIAVALNYQTEKSKKEEKRFYPEYVDEKDEDGYNKIPDKVTDAVKAVVSEKKALETKSERIKGGRQKTRVDED